MKNSTKPTHPITSVRTGSSYLDDAHHFLHSSQQLHTDTIILRDVSIFFPLPFYFFKEIKCSRQYVPQCLNSMDFSLRTHLSALWPSITQLTPQFSMCIRQSSWSYQFPLTKEKCIKGVSKIALRIEL